LAGREWWGWIACAARCWLNFLAKQWAGMVMADERLRRGELWAFRFACLKRLYNQPDLTDNSQRLNIIKSLSF
jgi:hypothetical protein